MTWNLVGSTLRLVPAEQKQVFSSTCVIIIIIIIALL